MGNLYSIASLIIFFPVLIVFTIAISRVTTYSSANYKKPSITESRSVSNLSNDEPPELNPLEEKKQEETAKPEEVTETETQKETEYEEMNPSIPVGSYYELGQGNYIVGEDIPLGRYSVSFLDGNPYGGHLKGQGDKIGSYTVEPDIDLCISLLDGDNFEISLASLRFTKISSLPNNQFLQTDGSYILPNGYYQTGIDIPCGKYDLLALTGSPYGIRIKALNVKSINIEPDETYTNLTLDNDNTEISIS